MAVSCQRVVGFLVVLKFPCVSRVQVYHVQLELLRWIEWSFFFHYFRKKVTYRTHRELKLFLFLFLNSHS